MTCCHSEGKRDKRVSSKDSLFTADKSDKGETRIFNQGPRNLPLKILLSFHKECPGIVCFDKL